VTLWGEEKPEDSDEGLGGEKKNKSDIVGVERGVVLVLAHWVGAGLGLEGEVIVGVERGVVLVLAYWVGAGLGLEGEVIVGVERGVALVLAHWVGAGLGLGMVMAWVRISCVVIGLL
jgi:hypothetical protein